MHCCDTSSHGFGHFAQLAPVSTGGRSARPNCGWRSA